MANGLNASVVRRVLLSGVRCNNVCICVRNLRTLNGPAMQLPVLLLSVLIPRFLSVCIDNISIGMSDYL